MGIRFNCPNGHKLNVKEFLAGKRGVCPQCGAKFIIPMPGERPALETPLPAATGLSQSIEIAVAPASVHQAVSASPSPSVIIPATDVGLATPESQLPPAIRESQIAAGDVLPASIVAVQSPIVAAPVEVAPEAAVASQRERTRRNQMVISLLLLALVVFLAGVLIWVLKREVNRAPVEKATTAVHKEFDHVFFATVNNGLFMNVHPRVGALEL